MRAGSIPAGGTNAAQEPPGGPAEALGRTGGLVAIVEVERDGGVMLIRMNRPERLNALGAELRTALAETWREFRDSPALEVAILTGTGRAFCAGEDMKESLARGAPGIPPGIDDPFTRGEINKPIIGAINGYAMGGGFSLALACDLRLAAEGSTFGFSCLAEGYIPWDGGSQRLPRIIGRARALELLLTGRSVSASEALEMGLVNAVTPGQTLEAAAIDLGQTIAGAAPIAVRYVKEAVYKGLDMSLAQGLNLEADLSFILQTTQDRRRGIQAFLNKTKPQFTGE